MIQYKFKIQWIFNKQEEAFKLISLLGARSFDKIILRDIDYKIVDYYNGFIQYPEKVATEETINYIIRQMQENEKIYYIEVLRIWF